LHLRKANDLSFFKSHRLGTETRAHGNVVGPVAWAGRAGPANEAGHRLAAERQFPAPFLSIGFSLAIDQFDWPAAESYAAAPLLRATREPDGRANWSPEVLFRDGQGVAEPRFSPGAAVVAADDPYRRKQGLYCWRKRPPPAEGQPRPSTSHRPDQRGAMRGRALHDGQPMKFEPRQMAGFPGVEERLIATPEHPIARNSASIRPHKCEPARPKASAQRPPDGRRNTRRPETTARAAAELPTSEVGGPTAPSKVPLSASEKEWEAVMVMARLCLINP